MCLHCVWHWSWEALSSVIHCQSIPNSSHLCLPTCRWAVWWYHGATVHSVQSPGGHNITAHYPVARGKDYLFRMKNVVKWSKAHSRQVQDNGTVDNLRRDGRTDAVQGMELLLTVVVTWRRFSRFPTTMLTFPVQPTCTDGFPNDVFTLHWFGLKLTGSHQVFVNLWIYAKR